MNKLSLCVLISLLQIPVAQAVIQGSDSRKYVSSRSGSPESKKAKSVAIMLPNSELTEKPGGKLDLTLYPLTFNFYLCSEEKEARTQGFTSACTGFLIAEDLVLTAGHCVLSKLGTAKNERTDMCKDFSWYFDFEGTAQSPPRSRNLSSNEIYRCAEVVEAVLEAKDPILLPEDFGPDYALVRLDRKVSGRTPLKLTRERPRSNETLTMIGHPLFGMKTWASGRQLKNEKNYVNVSIDALNGNSGSPVFNSRGEVFGIFVRGFPDDHAWDASRSCNKTNHCSENMGQCAHQDKADPLPPGGHVMPLDLIKALEPYFQ